MSPEHCDIDGVDLAGFSAQRILGESGTGANGPVLIVVGGIHGNEPSGVRALQDNHEATIWLILVEIGILRAHNVPGLDTHRMRLAEACERLPAVLEVIHRHEIEPGDGFTMDPGFINFEKVSQGQRLACAGAGLEQVVTAPGGGAS